MEYTQYLVQFMAWRIDELAEGNCQCSGLATPPSTDAPHWRVFTVWGDLLLMKRMQHCTLYTVCSTVSVLLSLYCSESN